VTNFTTAASIENNGARQRQASLNKQKKRTDKLAEKRFRQDFFQMSWLQSLLN